MTNPTPPPQNSGGTAATSDPRRAKFKIPFAVEQKFPDLIDLILGTESMNDDERQYWFQILPIMSQDQVDKLRKILLNEKEQLVDLDKRYAQELNDINGKHGNEWDAYKAKEKRQEIHTKEKAQESDEAKLEEDILNKLDEA